MKAYARGFRRKSFLMIAATAATASFGALSNTACAQSSVKIGGAMDMGVGMYDIGGKKAYGVTNGAIAASSLKFSGNDDLGGGYSSQFLVRSLFNSGTGALVSGLLFASEAKVGLTAPAGNLQVGRLFSLNDTFFLWNSPSSSNYAGAWNMALSGYAAYWNNALRYTSPDWNGFTAIIEHSRGIVDNEVAGSLNGVGTEYGLNYERGPLQLRSVLEKTYAQVGTATNYRADRLSLGGIYDFGVLKAHLAYYNEAYSGSGQPAPFDIKFAGVTVPFNSVWKATAEYGYKHYTNATSHVEFTGLGLYYSMSKNVTLFSQAVFVQNHGPLASYTIYHSPVSPAAGMNTSGITFEMRYTF